MGIANESKTIYGVQSLCRTYKNFSIAFFVLMIICPAAMFIPLIGLQAPYFMFVFVLKSVSEWEVITPGVHALVLLIALEASFFFAFIKTSKLALKENKVLPFLILAFGSHAFTIAIFVIDALESGSFYIPLDVICSIIANTIFLILLSIKYWKCQKTDVSGEDGSITENNSM